MLWDTAGQEEFDAITKAYYRGEYVLTTIRPLSHVYTSALQLTPTPGAHVCVLAFSTVDRDSFLAIEQWKRKVLPSSLLPSTGSNVCSAQ